jgi:hypothetical protein
MEATDLQMVSMQSVSLCFFKTKQSQDASLTSLKRQSGDASLTSLTGKAGTFSLPRLTGKARTLRLPRLTGKAGDASLTKQSQLDYAQAVSL